MRITLRPVFVLATLGAVAAFIGTGTSLAAPGGGGLTRDFDSQLGALQTEMNVLPARDGAEKTGTLSAAANCGYGPSAQTFLPWGDGADYALAPQGDIASTSDWTLRSVSLRRDHDPYTQSAGSLAFSRGDAEAVTPVMCVDLTNPTIRFFIAHRGGSGTSALKVSVRYEGLDGNVHVLTLAQLTADGSWQPSPVLPIGVNMISPASVNGWTPVAFAFQVEGLRPGETYSVDGIYVDPCMGR